MVRSTETALGTTLERGRNTEEIWNNPVEGHKTVVLFLGASKEPIHNIMRQVGDGVQTHRAQVPADAKHVPTSARNIIQAYLDMVDWRHSQDGGSRGEAQDWSISPEFVK